MSKANRTVKRHNITYVSNYATSIQPAAVQAMPQSNTCTIEKNNQKFQITNSTMSIIHVPAELKHKCNW